MIAADQPTCFPSNVIVGVSSRQDGTMLDRTARNIHEASIIANRERACDAVGIRYRDCVYQIIRYDKQCTYDVIGEVDRPDPEGVYADVLYTEKPGVGLFLPVADCIATVLYDPVRKAIALAHLGRHASVARTMEKTVAFLCEQGSQARDLVIWMAPSVLRDSYRMEYFTPDNNADWSDYSIKRKDGVYVDLPGFNGNLAQQSGVLQDNIHLPAADTAINPNYFSHSQGDKTGRFAVFVMMR